jgi:hypothetical protein
LYSKIISTKSSDGIYPYLCLLINNYFNKPSWKDNPKFLLAIQNLIELGKITPTIINKIATHNDPINFIKACLIVENEDLFDALYFCKNPLMSAKFLKKADENNFSNFFCRPRIKRKLLNIIIQVN